MNKKSIWSLKLNTATLVLIPVAIGINYVGKAIATALNLPLWLDSIGTILSAFIGGPIVGAISGGLNNIIFGLSGGPTSLVYALTSITIGIMAGVFATKSTKKTVIWATIIGLLIAIVAVFVSTPLNVIFWSGYAGNLVADTIFESLCVSFNVPAEPATFGMYIASFLAGLVVDIPDKIITMLVVLGIYKNIPQNILVLFDSQAEIEKID